MNIISNYSYSSGLNRVSPKSKILFSILPLLLCIILDSVPVSILTVIAMCFTSVRFGRISLKKYTGLIMIPFGFLAVGTLTILVNRFEPGHAVLVGINIGQAAYGIDRYTLVACAKLVLKALGAVSCMYFLSLNTPMADLFQVLRRTKLPDVIVTLMELIYQYIFILLEEAGRMSIAKDSRLGNRSFATSLKSLGELAGMLFIRAYQRSERIFAALESRGYTGEFLTLEEEYVNSKIMNTASVILCCSLIFAWVAERALL
jgi:cobalt/nickel transport system permease protein